MTGTVHVLMRPACAAGFQLAGLAVTEAHDGASAAVHIRRLVADPDVGVVLVDAALYRSLPREVTARLERQAIPVVAPVPAPNWNEQAEAEAYVLEILRQAIGYRVRPR
ncbi:MAG: V-type ATP synthase subunit F [Acidobacteriota bacterium]|nr:V-type ATP synthase subunit F [Acidobacteriota bacterium]